MRVLSSRLLLLPSRITKYRHIIEMSCAKCISNVNNIFVFQVLVTLRYLRKGSFVSECGNLHGISKSSVCRAEEVIGIKVPSIAPMTFRKTAIVKKNSFNIQYVFVPSWELDIFNPFA
jgi:hypothetical protein